MTVYIVCSQCMVGAVDDESGFQMRKFLNEHLDHRILDFVSESEFLSKYLQEGYVDVDRPELDAIKLALRTNTPSSEAEEQRQSPFGMPASRTDLAETHRRLMAEHRRTKTHDSLIQRLRALWRRLWKRYSVAFMRR